MTRIWSSYHDNGRGWFRLFGYGLTWQDKGIHGLPFSARMGITKGLTIGKWYITFLEK